MAHIYKITNTQNGKVYIGQTKGRGLTRLSAHRTQLRGDRHKNCTFQSDWNTHGEESFTFEELLICSPEDMNFYEARAIKAYDCIHPKGYNLTSGGSSFREVSSSTRDRQSASRKGRRASPETRAKMSEAQKGVTHSLEVRAKIAASHKGIHPSQETRAKIAEAAKGRTPSPEARKKMSDSKKGLTHSPETRDKISKVLKGKPKSPESVAKGWATRRRNKELKALQGSSLS